MSRLHLQRITGAAVVACCAAVGFVPSTAAAAKTNLVRYPPANAQVPEFLAQRKAQQEAGISKSGVYHDFQFTDAFAASGITFQQVSVEDALKTWKPAHYDHGTAVAVADVDGDGKLDVYFVNQLGPNQLWRNLGDGRFHDITAKAGVGVPGKIHVAASFADIDNDGDADLFVTTVNMGNVLFENVGDGKFRDVTAAAGISGKGHSSGAVFFDYDRDGLLDLFVCNVGVYTTDTEGPGGFKRAVQRAFGGHLEEQRYETSVLYKNLGDRKFRDVTQESGLVNRAWTGDATFADLDHDGFPGIYAANMQGDDHFFENVGGKFTDRTRHYFPKTPWGAMGVKFFDFNLDGALDLYVTDMHSDMSEPQTIAGRRTMGAQFEKSKSEAWCTAFWNDSFLQGASNNIFGNAFYANREKGKFEEISEANGTETYWPWGPSAGDLNADGYEDLFVTAGMGWPFRYAINSVLLNARGERFVDAEFAVGVEPRMGGRIDKPMFLLDCENDPEKHDLCKEYGPFALMYGSLSSRSSAILDLDGDGDLDIITNEMNDRPMVLVSDLSKRRRVNWLQVKLVGTTSNRDGLGAMVKARVGNLTLTRFHDGKSGYLAQSSMPLYFGLGEATAVTSLEVTWPSGKKQTITKEIAVNSLLTVREN